MTHSVRTLRRASDLVCLSHLRWNFVYQRPNHLMARAAADRRVFFIEDPERRGAETGVEVAERDGVTVVRLIFPEHVSYGDSHALLRQQLDAFLASQGVRDPWLWYYTPMALPWTEHLQASAVIYDCMDELSAFKFCPPELRDLERKLIARADVLYTGGRSLFEAKRGQHRNTFLFPSSVDAAHFGQARTGLPDPEDQAAIAHPRVGYFGVIDERIDLDLIARVAQARPDWQIVMVGPVTKIAEDDLPRGDNLHWLGLKSYAELPAYLGGWDVAIMPFALNESTLHISPTKTPEYLSGGRPVVSTPIRDVVRPYGDEGLVSIAADAEQFVAAIESALTCDRDDLIGRADRFLASQSWDATWAEMERTVDRLRVRRVAVPVGPSRSTAKPRPAVRMPALDGGGLPAAALPTAASLTVDTRITAASGGGSMRSRPR